MRVGKRIGSWPAYRQLTGTDRRSLGTRGARQYQIKYRRPFQPGRRDRAMN
jgi:hypothetical protein